MSEQKQVDLWGNETKLTPPKAKKSRKSKEDKQKESSPDKLGKAVKLPVPDFSDPNRKLTCLEVDFPIAQINALSNLEGNAGKPIYQMSKWWARRRSSVFRSMLIAAATEAPEDASEAAKRVWEHYYCNHQKGGSFKNLRVLDCFMGGGTTLVEGSRLGMQVTGVDLNPIAWFVVKNELACSDPEQVKAFFKYIEEQVKPQVQPFYTTICPRGHKGRWINQNGEEVAIDPLDLPPEQRSSYHWEGPEIIYTFWAKHGSCQSKGCGHRTPIFRTPIVAEKKLSTNFLELVCPGCGIRFHAELGETRMAPGTERVILEGEVPFTELTQNSARMLNHYDKGTANETWERALELKALIKEDPGLHCPECGLFAGKRLADVLERHVLPNITASKRKKKDFGIKKKPVQMYLLIHPDWLKGMSGVDSDGNELGGWAGAIPEATSAWFENRLANLSVVEIRGKNLPELIVLNNGTVIETSTGTVPKQAHFTCGFCGKNQSRLDATKKDGHTAPIATYALLCNCPQCEIEGYNFGGRYFKTPDIYDIKRLNYAEKEWYTRKNADLNGYWPWLEILYSMRTHVKDPLPDHGYTHWWKLFNNRQLLVHAALLKTITESSEASWPLDVREQALGAFQQYLRYQTMMAFYHVKKNHIAPHFSNANYNPKNLCVENSVFLHTGMGNWRALADKVIEALEWNDNPWEVAIESNETSSRVNTNDKLIYGANAYCGSSTDLSFIAEGEFDLVITDPPFGDNVYYADCSDFFYVWLGIPLQKWYAGLTEQQYFKPERTPHSLEVIDNPVEHPDDREDYEKDPFIETKHLSHIRQITGEESLMEKDINPLYRPQPSNDFYRQTLSACWAEAGRLLKDGGIMAFTFHHSEDEPWIDVLKALFDAGFFLVATYPIRSDESKGDSGQFGSKKIEYDIIHICRKRLDIPEPVSWARMRRWVREETVHLKNLLEHTHGKVLPESDLRVILRGKALEFYSRHYGQVFTGDGQVLDVRDALLGINQLLDDLLESTLRTRGQRPPESAEPASRLYLRLFTNRVQMERDELHKTLRGTGISQGDLEARGWIRVAGRITHVVPINERFAFLTAPGRNRRFIMVDLDQAHFLIGAALPNSGVKIDAELANPNFRIKRSVDDLLKWYAEVDSDSTIRTAAKTAIKLVEHWRTRKDQPKDTQPTLFDLLEENA